MSAKSLSAEQAEAQIADTLCREAHPARWEYLNPDSPCTDCTEKYAPTIAAMLSAAERTGEQRGRAEVAAADVDAIESVLPTCQHGPDESLCCLACRVRNALDSVPLAHSPAADAPCVGCDDRQSPGSEPPEFISPTCPRHGFAATSPAVCDCGHAWEHHGPDVPGCVECRCYRRGDRVANGERP